MRTLLPFSCLVLCAFTLTQSVEAVRYPWWPTPVKHPVVFFPAFGTSRLKVQVREQKFSTSCAKNASYEFNAGHIAPKGFPEACTVQALKLVYNEKQPVIAKRFSSLPGVTVEVANFGLPICAPLYAPFYLRLAADGYIPGKSLFGACYDWRMAPNVDVTPGHTFVGGTKALVEKAYAANSNSKVYLVAHSNGGPMALYLMRKLGAAWTKKHIAGFIPYAGNWAGQGSFIQYLFTGYSFFDFATPLPSAAFTTQTWPAVYFSLAQPAIFGKKEVILQAGSKKYTPADYKKLFADAKLKLAAKLLPLFTGLVPPLPAPPVNVFNFYGTGLTTLIGLKFKSLKQGVLPVGVLNSLGDGNQENLDNLATVAWKSNKKKGLIFDELKLYKTEHFLIPFNATVQAKTISILNNAKCLEPFP